MTLLVMLLTTATAWAENNVPYFDPTAPVGQQAKTQDGVIVINDENKPETMGTANQTTWYIVEGSVSYTSYITFIGDVNLILADGAKLTVGDNDEFCIFVDGGSLAIYAQSTGSNQGTITIAPYVYDSEYSTYANNGIYASGNINIYGGTINTTGIYHGIQFTGDISIYGGTLTATATATENGTGIYSNSGDITINGGQVTAIGEGSYGIDAGKVTITAGIVTATGDDNGIDASEVTINGGIINASGKQFGITAYRMYSQTAANTITIKGGTVTASGESQGIRAYNTITIMGGTLTATGTADYSIGIYAAYKDIIINGGEIYATGEETGICSDYGSVSLNGGKVESSGDYGIEAGNDITLSGATVKATYYYESTVKVAEGFNYTDGNNTYSSTAPLTDDQKENIAGKTIKPCITGKENDNNYWTTFYSGSVGFTIDNAVNACAYTATYGLNSNDEGELTMHELGKVIPKETAVIIVSESGTITMGADAATSVSTVPANNLHGVDVLTATSAITTELGTGTFYVMGKTTVGSEDHFGFHIYSGSNMPARKAFLLINGNQALARSISMVFEEATGIQSIAKEQIDNDSDAWYSLDGRKLMEKPTTKGLYINNGKKIVIK